MTDRKIPFFLHDLGQPELDTIAKVFQGVLLTTGDTVKEFEERFARLLGVRFALGVTSCTGALHMALLALKIGPGDEVITTPMTFVATANAILEAGATPVLADVEADTGLMDPNCVVEKITARTRAIIPVHLYGQMCDMRAYRELADRFGLHLIEDAAHCIEGSRDGIRPGQLGDVACFSFYATKNLTCGEGGAVVCNNADLLDRLRLLRLHGMTKCAADRAREGYQHWDMTTLGWKYNMDNIQAAILLPQLDRLKANIAKRQRLAAHYEHLLAGIPEIRRPKTCDGVQHAQHLFPVWVHPTIRDAVIQHLHHTGIASVVNYRAIHLLTYFKECLHHARGDFPRAETIGNSTLSLPFYPNMPLEDANRTVAALQTESRHLRHVG